MFPLISFLCFAFFWRQAWILSDTGRRSRHWLWRNIEERVNTRVLDDLCFLAGVALVCLVGSLIWELVSYLRAVNIGP